MDMDDADTNDFDIEIQHVHDDSSQSAASADNPQSQSPFSPHLTRRGKFARALATGSVVLAACLLLLAISPTLRSAFISARTPAQSLGENIFLDHTVPWGALTVDGKRISAHAIALNNSLMLVPGAHTLTYTAPPFAPLHCHLRVPYSATDNCPLMFSPPQSSARSAPTPIFVRIIDLGATPDRLPNSQHASLVEVTDQALQKLTTAAPLSTGERYLTPDLRVLQTTIPLVGALKFAINSNLSLVTPYLPGGRLCSQICYVDQAQTIPNVWRLLAFAQVSWSYGAPSGSVVIPSAPANPMHDGSVTLITIDANWDGSWHVTAQPTEDRFGVNPVCDVAADTMPPLPTLTTQGFQYEQREVALPTLADGCLIVTRFFDADHNVSVANGDAYTLYRFGVTLAANARAHTLWPQLPLATAADRAFMSSSANGG